MLLRTDNAMYARIPPTPQTCFFFQGMYHEKPGSSKHGLLNEGIWSRLDVSVTNSVWPRSVLTWGKLRKTLPTSSVFFNQPGGACLLEGSLFLGLPPAPNTSLVCLLCRCEHGFPWYSPPF